MKTQITNLLVAVVATFALASVGSAQQTTIQQPEIQTRVMPVQQYVQPGVQPIQQNPYYFGMSVAINRDSWGRTTLRIVNVTPGSPAQLAGLELGDEIRTVNGRGFRFATDSFDAVRRMNQYVITPAFGGGGPAPAVASGVVAAYVQLPNPNPIARMVVRNVRNGQNVIVNVRPTRVGGGPIAPAAAAAVVSADG